MTPLRLLPALCLGLLLALPAAPPARAQSNDTQFLIERINRLENDLRTLQRQVYRGGPAGQGNVTPQGGVAVVPSTGSLTDGDGETSAANRLNARIDQLESQLREMVGRFEEVEFKTSQSQKRMDKLVEDVDFRLNQLEKNAPPAGSAPPQQQGAAPAPAQQTAAAPASGNSGGQAGQSSAQPGQAPSKEGVLGSLPTDAQGRPLQGAAPVGASGGGVAGANASRPPAAAAPSARGKLPPGSPQDRYNYAYRLLTQSDYADAEAAFKEFVAAHGADPLAGNAQYWLGETYYVRQQYESAAAAFLQGYQGYPKGAKASDSLLKLGMSLTALKKNAEACAAFQQLQKEFPAAPPHVKEATGRERAKAGCR